MYLYEHSTPMQTIHVQLTRVVSVLVDAPAVAGVDDGAGVVDGVPPAKRWRAAAAAGAGGHDVHRALSRAPRLRELLRPRRWT